MVGSASFPQVLPNPILWAHVLGIKGIVAATAELVAALGAVKMHAASSGQGIREFALGTVCKGQLVRAGPYCSSELSRRASKLSWALMVLGLRTRLLGAALPMPFS